MNISTIVVVLTAAWVGFSAYAIWARRAFVVDNISAYGVSRRWWPWLGTAKAVGALGLLVGLMVPAIGVVASAGLVLYFSGAVVTVIRAKAYGHIPFPLLFLAPSAVAGWLVVGA